MKGVDMAEPDESAMSYGCQFGCGNGMEIVMVQIRDGSLLMVCIPCFVRVAIDIVDAMTGGNGTNLTAEMAELKAMDAEQAPGPRARRRGHNAPVGNTDPDLFEAFDTAVTVDELDDRFK